MFKQSKFKQMALKIKDVYSPIMEGVAVSLAKSGFTFEKKKTTPSASPARGR
jgi:hypothetical protein